MKFTISKNILANFHQLTLWSKEHSDWLSSWLKISSVGPHAACNVGASVSMPRWRNIFWSLLSSKKIQLSSLLCCFDRTSADQSRRLFWWVLPIVSFFSKGSRRFHSVNEQEHESSNPCQTLRVKFWIVNWMGGNIEFWPEKFTIQDLTPYSHIAQLGFHSILTKMLVKQLWPIRMKFQRAMAIRTYLNC